jgi:glycosyltransferase involved in cell wall biosynthesis
VLVLFPFLAVGGAERVAIDMMRNLKDKVRFVVVTVEVYEASLGKTVDDFQEVTPYVYTAPDYLSPHLNFSFFVHLIERFKPQTLYVANGAAWIYDVLWSLKKQFPELRIANQVYDYCVGWIERYDEMLASVIDANIGCNDKICEAYIAKGVASERAYVIDHGVDITEYDPRRYSVERIKQLKVQFQLPTDKKIIASLSRLHPQKRPMDFVELARQLSTDETLHFFMVGDGPLKQAIDNTIRQIGLANITRLPFYKPSSDLLAVADMIILPSEYEGMPLVVLEAQAMGRPVVATDVGKTRDIIDTTSGGIVVADIGNVPALRQAVIQLLDMPLNIETMRQAVIDHYDLEKIATQYYRVLLGTNKNDA